MAVSDVSFILSEIANIDRTFSELANHITVLPCSLHISAVASNLLGRDMLLSKSSFLLPAKYFSALISAITPLPVILLKLVTDKISSLLKCSTIASAKGCSDCFSILASIDFDDSSVQTSSVTCGLPSVIVPVLSSTTVVTFFATSKLSASFINIPSSAPLPMPTIIAVGVARPKAHGQAITSTVTNERRA